MIALPDAVQDAMDAFSDLPGIGARSAERLILTLLRNTTGLDKKIARTIGDLKERVVECSQCCFLCENNGAESICALCKDAKRNQHRLCVVAEPADVLALERTHSFQGQYHVLHGVISPLHRIRPEDVRVAELFARLADEGIEEVIFALPSSTEAEATTLYIIEKAKSFFTGKVTRLARGIPSGGDLDYLDAGTLSRALTERREIHLHDSDRNV